MNNNQQKMSGYLEKAKKVMKVTDAMRPIVQSNQYIPTLAESASLEGVSVSSYDDQSLNYEPIKQNGIPTPSSNKLPQSILESLISNPIQEPTSSGLSVLDSIIPQKKAQLSENFDYMEKETPSTVDMFSKRINEGRFVHQQPQTTTGGVIDYSLIKLMIEDAISKEFKILKKTMLNESKQNAVNSETILTVGDSIKFIAKNGNIYEGKVKLIGNVNK